MPELHVLPTVEDTMKAAAEFISALTEKRIRAQDYFTIALSGGTTPRGLYRLLASPPYMERIAWERWQVFWGDERCVPPEHEDSNYRMAREALLGHVPIPADRIYRIRGETPPEEAAMEYEERLREVFQSPSPVFDLILLGIGGDGHIASLFPNTDALQEKRRQVVANWVPELQSHRITFTLPLINKARVVAFLVTEESKAGVLREVLQPSSQAQMRPAALVSPASGIAHWFLTGAAASHLYGSDPI